jgi:hypothetical protein
MHYFNTKTPLLSPLPPILLSLFPILLSLGDRDSICEQEDDGWDSGGSAVGRESSGGVSGGGAANAHDGAVHFAEAIDLADQDDLVEETISYVSHLLLPPL